jgi:hypothetical protein
MNQRPEFLESLELVTDALEELAIDYFVTASLASASHGVARATDFDANAMRRARAASPPDSYPTATPEDIILFKLQWLAASGENSQRHRQDVLGVIRAQSDHLDVNYLEECAAVLGVDSLLREVLDS